MPYQNIDTSVSTTDLQAIREAFASIRQKLPFLVALTTAERRATFKAGPDSLSFVTNALSAAQANPEIFPASFSVEAFQRDFDLFTLLTDLATQADSLATEIDDTRLALGGEAMRQAIQVYDYVKAAVKTTPGLRPVAEQLGERFRKSGSAPPPPPPVP